MRIAAGLVEPIRAVTVRRLGDPLASLGVAAVQADRQAGEKAIEQLAATRDLLNVLGWRPPEHRPQGDLWCGPQHIGALRESVNVLLGVDTRQLDGVYGQPEQQAAAELMLELHALARVLDIET